MLHCTGIFFPRLNHTDLFSVIYQAGNGKKNEKYRGCSNVSTSQLTGVKGKLRRGNEVEALSFIRRQPDVRLSMLQVNKSWNGEPPAPIQPPFQLPSSPTAVDYCIAPPPQSPNLIISKFKHIIFHLFIQSAIKILPSRAPLVLYPLL